MIKKVIDSEYQKQGIGEELFKRCIKKDLI